jgi:serine/threonine protein kinase
VELPDGTRAVPLGSGIVQGLIGEGGAARVYEIHNKRYNVFRAIKVLKPAQSAEARARFEREMAIMPCLHHPNIVTVFDTGIWNDLPYIEMERVRGVSLDALVAERGALPLVAGIAIGIAVCRALAYVHSHEFTVGGQLFSGMLHRDLKPANVLLSDKGIVKLTDFGAARALASSHPVAAVRVPRRPSRARGRPALRHLLTGVRALRSSHRAARLHPGPHSRAGGRAYPQRV